MKLVFISDTHGMHDAKVLNPLPEGDVLIHCGDHCGRGDLPETWRFLKWFEEQPHKHKLFIVGNHDWAFERTPQEARALVPESITYLEDAEITIDGVKFYGAPWTPQFFNWAFMLDRGPSIERKWKMIPKDVDVLITHGPPYGIADRAPDGQFVGCADLLLYVKMIKPQVHAFGHIHGGGKRGYDLHGEHGVEDMPTRFVNACTCNEEYGPTQSPVVIEIGGA